MGSAAGCSFFFLGARFILAAAATTVVAVVAAEGAGGADSAMVDFSRRGFVVSNDVATSLHNMFDNGVNQPLDPKLFDGKRSRRDSD